MDANLSRARILVVDDEQAQLDILQRWLSHSGYAPEVATNGFDAVALASKFKFEVIVTDLRMPGMSGLQLLSIFKELDPEVEIIFLTGQGTMQDAIDALKEGKAFDFLQKPLRDLGQLNAVIEGARARRARLREAPSDHAADSPVQVFTPPPEEADMTSPLTEQEIAMLQLLAQGLDNRAIGERLNFSEKTVRNYLSRAYHKLNVSNRVQALTAARQQGIVG